MHARLELYANSANISDPQVHTHTHTHTHTEHSDNDNNTDNRKHFGKCRRPRRNVTITITGGEDNFHLHLKCCHMANNVMCYCPRAWQTHTAHHPTPQTTHHSQINVSDIHTKIVKVIFQIMNERWNAKRKSVFKC